LSLVLNVIAAKGFTAVIARCFRSLLLSVLATVPLVAQDRTLTVYSSRSHYGAESVFEEFTRQTGIKVEFFSGNNNEVLERLRAEGSRSPADVFLAVDAGNLWHAAQLGLLQPVRSAVLERNIPAHLRDPEGQWFAIAVRARTIVYSTERVRPTDLGSYADLADPKWRGRICLRSSSAVYNQSLVASFIAGRGERATEQMLRGWMANAPTILASDTPVLQAIAAGQCDVGITNHYYLARLKQQQPDLPVAAFWADQGAGGTHVNISGAGVTRHTRHRAEAVRFLEFLSTPDAQTRLAAGSFEFPANPAATAPALAAAMGQFAPQTIGVAAAGVHQAAAVRLMDRVGYR
jgi:iron(III) transport system substrate-binding protein